MNFGRIEQQYILHLFSRIQSQRLQCSTNIANNLFIFSVWWHKSGTSPHNTTPITIIVYIVFKNNNIFSDGSCLFAVNTYEQSRTSQQAIWGCIFAQTKSSTVSFVCRKMTIFACLIKVGRLYFGNISYSFHIRKFQTEGTVETVTLC